MRIILLQFFTKQYFKIAWIWDNLLWQTYLPYSLILRETIWAFHLLRILLQYLTVGFSLVLVSSYKVHMAMCIFVCFNIIDYISFSTHDHNCYFLLQSIKHCFPKKIVTFFPEGMIYYAISTLILTTQDKHLQFESVHWLEVNVMPSDAQTIFTQEQGMSYFWRNRINSVVG